MPEAHTKGRQRAGKTLTGLLAENRRGPLARRTFVRFAQREPSPCCAFAAPEDEETLVSAEPKLLLVHDDDLADVRHLLADIGTPYVERTGAPTEIDLRTQWDLVIASQRRMGHFEGNEATEKTRRIVVVDNDSRTMRSMMRRQGVNFIVARPVHAAAMRLLVLHCIYRGPERRRQGRVSVGAEVQIKSGLFRRDAILADLSLHGFRLVADKALKSGSKVKLIFPQEIACGKSFSLPGRILRSAPGAQGEASCVIAGAFHDLKPAQGKRLRKVYENYQGGPAKLETSGADLMKTPEEASDEASERRTEPRGEYDKHVVAVDDEATRVLLCRDISVGGMRVQPNETLVPGDEVKVAVHVRSRAEPLVVSARVTRDDGEAGLVLEFFNLSEKSEAYLRKMVNLLPILGVKAEREDGDDDQPDLIVSEIVERHAS